LLRKAKPDVVVATQALPCNVIAYEKRAGRIQMPLVGVLTDFVAHRYWVARGVDLFCVPAEETRDELHRRGIGLERLRVTCIPISRSYTSPKDRAAAKHSFRLDARRPAVLVSGGTKGLGGIEEAVVALAGLKAAPEV